MKNSFSHSSIFFSSGLLLILIAGSLDIFWAKITLNSLGIIMEFIGMFLLVKELRNKNKSTKDNLQHKEESIRIYAKKLNSLLLPLFSSMLSLVSILVLLMFFSIDKIDMWKMYLKAIAIVQAIIMFASCVQVFSYLNNKNDNK